MTLWEMEIRAFCEYLQKTVVAVIKADIQRNHISCKIRSPEEHIQPVKIGKLLKSINGLSADVVEDGTSLRISSFTDMGNEVRVQKSQHAKTANAFTTS